MNNDKCTIPPSGWHCTRKSGHAGPCAAIPDTTAPEPAERAQASAYLQTITQDLFAKPVFTELNDCYEQGNAASDQGFRRDQNPYPASTAQREWWDGGWSGSLDELTGE